MMSGLGSGLPSLDPMGLRVQASLNSPTFSIPIAWESCQRQPDALPLSYRGTVCESVHPPHPKPLPQGRGEEQWFSSTYFIQVGWLCTCLPDTSSSRLLPSVSSPQYVYSLLSIDAYIFPGSLSIQ